MRPASPGAGAVAPRHSGRATAAATARTIASDTRCRVNTWPGWACRTASHRRPSSTKFRSLTPAPTAAAPTGGGQKKLINLNTATQAELETLPGIGPVYAGNIIAHREANPFRTVEDVEQVPGIGPKRLEAIRPLVTVE